MTTAQLSTPYAHSEYTLPKGEGPPGRMLSSIHTQKDQPRRENKRRSASSYSISFPLMLLFAHPEYPTKESPYLCGYPTRTITCPPAVSRGSVREADPLDTAGGQVLSSRISTKVWGLHTCLWTEVEWVLGWVRTDGRVASSVAWYGYGSMAEYNRGMARKDI